MKYDYDIVVIGGGSGGLTSSKLANALGKKVALVEKKRLGGECTWTGCIPSKALIKSASIAYGANNLKKYGLQTKQDLEIDSINVLHHVRDVVLDVYKTHTPEVLSSLGIDVLFGEPTFIDEHYLFIDGVTISAEKFIIATGSEPYIPKIEGLSGVSYLTNETMFNIDHFPLSMIILGGGAIGTEMASALNRLGIRVQLVEMEDRLLSKEDPELVEMLTKRLVEEGVMVSTGMKATKIIQDSGYAYMTCVDKEGNVHEFDAQRLLVAVGRRPNIKGLYLERAKIETHEKGIKVDKTLRTTAPNIWACGDVVGPYLFSHMAYYQASIAVRNALLPFFKKKIDYSGVAWVTFTDPELATAGYTEEQAREKFGDDISVYRYSYDKLDRAYTDCDRDGLAKFICDKKGYLLGAHILGARAGELISEVQLGKYHNLEFSQFYPVIHPYPTYSEIIWHSARQQYIDKLQNMLVVRMFQKIRQWLGYGQKR